MISRPRPSSPSSTQTAASVSTVIGIWPRSETRLALDRRPDAARLQESALELSVEKVRCRLDLHHPGLLLPSHADRRTRVCRLDLVGACMAGPAPPRHGPPPTARR